MAPAQTVNPFVPQLVPQPAETPVSPVTPSTTPGGLTNETSGNNPLTGLPCTGQGSLAVSGAGALSDSATPPPDQTLLTPQLPTLSSVFGSSTALGSC